MNSPVPATDPPTGGDGGDGGGGGSLERGGRGGRGERGEPGGGVLLRGALGRPDLLPHDRPLAPAPDLAIELSRSARARGQRDAAIAWVEGCLRGGYWTRARLWSELGSLMDSPDDFAGIRRLWLSSPSECHRTVPVLRAVARAACVAGHHDEARALLRKAIGLAARARKRPRARLRAGVSKAVLRKRSRRRADGKRFQRQAAAALVDLNAALAGTGARTFLLGGTLLGFVRDGDLIPWDKDIDVGVLADEVDPAELERLLAADSRFAVKRLDFNSPRLRVHHRNGVMIDIFIHFTDDRGMVWHDGAATRWWNKAFELQPVEFLGVRQYVPADPEAYLEESYGDWRTPDPEFDARLDKPNVEVIDQGYFDTAMYFALLDAVTKGNRVKRRRFTGLLRDLGEGTWLDHV